jgi:hypothetical protein
LDIEGNSLEIFSPDGSNHIVKIFRKVCRSTIHMAAAYPWVSLVSGKAETILVIRAVTKDHLLQNLREKLLDDITQEVLTPLAALNASVELFRRSTNFHLARSKN